MNPNPKYLKVALLLILAIAMISCVNITALLNSIVASTEAVLPYITQLSPADQAAVAAYVNGVATITETLLKCGSGVDTCVTTAINQFNTLILPTLSTSVSPTIREAIAAVSIAIAAFIAAEGGVSNAAMKNLKISDSKRTEFQSRIGVVKAKLIPYLHK